VLGSSARRPDGTPVTEPSSNRLAVARISAGLMRSKWASGSSSNSRRETAEGRGYGVRSDSDAGRKRARDPAIGG